MAEKLGVGFHSEVYAVNDALVIKIARLPACRTIRTSLGEAAYRRARREIEVLGDYLGGRHCLRTRVQVEPTGLWCIEQERLPANYQVVSSTSPVVTDNLQEIALRARKMVDETNLWLDWFGLESLRINFIKRVIVDENYWILPNIKLIPQENNEPAQIKIADTGLFGTRISLFNDQLIYPHEPLTYLLQEKLLGIVQRRSGVVF